MSLLSLLIVLIIFGVIAWIVTLLPIPQPFRNIIWIVLVLILLVWLLSMLGGVGFLHRSVLG